MPPTLSDKSCFLCTEKLKTSCQEKQMNSLHAHLCQILELSPDFEKIDNNVKILYCDSCVQRISKIQVMLDELEQLEAKVILEKHLIEAQLKECSRVTEKLKTSFGSEELLIRGQIVNELQSTTIKSMLEKIRKRQVGQKKSGRSIVRIVKDFTIAAAATGIAPDKTSQLYLKTSNEKFNTEKNDSKSFPILDTVSANQKSKNTAFQPAKRAKPPETKFDVTRTVTPYSNPRFPNGKYERSPVRRWDFAIEECSQDDIDMNLVAEDNPDIEPVVTDAIFGRNNLPFEMNDEEDSFGLDDPDLDLDLQSYSMNEELNCSENDETYMYQYQWNRESNMDKLKEDDGDSCSLNQNSVGMEMEDLKYEWTNSTKTGIPSGRSQKKRSNRNPMRSSPKELIELQNSRKGPMKCDECGRVLASYYTWRNHVLSIHRGQHKHHCPHCNYGTQKFGDLEKHLVIHSDVRNFSCQFCSSSFKRESALRQHLKRHTPNPNVPIQIEIY